LLSITENIPIVLCQDHRALSKKIAREIVDYAKNRATMGKSAVLGLCTGSTPIDLYAELISLHRKGETFANVITFNLDEYFPISYESPHSYHRYMYENLFDHLDIPDDQIFIPRGDLKHCEIESYCQWYEKQISAAGGIGIQLLGIGLTGHIGFNEPGSLPDTRTRLVRLDEITRKNAASDFFGEENVPKEALTMGVGTILDADRIILLATGEHKASIIQQAVEGEVSPLVAASYLQTHPNTSFFIDASASSELKRAKQPWLNNQELTWTDQLTQRAIIWLCEQVKKPVLHLQKRDYNLFDLYSLVDKTPSVDELNRKTFDAVQDKIINRQDLYANKRCICFSPHPDDDVISMGGTLLRLAKAGNEMNIAYMTSGNIAVFDEDVNRLIDFVRLTFRDLGCPHKQFEDIVKIVRSFLETKQPGQIDIPEVQAIKTNIRRSEAIAAASTLGISANKIRFLDLPFYQTGLVKKNPISNKDVSIVLDLLNKIQPEIVFVAGDLSDPHGTHRMCKEVIDQALALYRKPKPEVWLYRGAWQEWEVDEADIFIPLSHEDLQHKIQAIFRHESQKDTAMFPGAHDDREFWERVQDRNIHTARRLDKLGFPQYYAMEAFVVE